MSHPPDPKAPHAPHFLHSGGTQRLRLSQRKDKDCDVPLSRKNGLFTTPRYKPGSTSAGPYHPASPTTAGTDMCQSDGGGAVGMMGSGVRGVRNKPMGMKT